MSSYEIIPPVEKDGRTSIVGIAINDSGAITISHHTNLVGETDKEKLREPEDFKSVTFPIEQLKWLAPRLEGVRQFLKIEDGYKQLK
tara:strand:- start:220 stop:480 length:261 start_codon:yes stop_codon:yes gene_type:complete